MKHVLIAIVAFLASCGDDQNIKVIPPVQETTETYITTKINGFEISLRNRNGQCVLFYSKQDKYRPLTDRHIVLDMEAPCNFIHLAGRDELEFFEYGKPPFKFKVFIVVGGPPDPEHPEWKDRFMPDGCGTMTEKLLIYDDRIRVEFPAWKDPGNCPSEPTDEVFFAT